MDEGVGQELARLLQVTAMLDGVGQDAWQQPHVLALGFNVARFEQREMGEDKRDDALLRLSLPLADHPCRRRQALQTNFNSAQQKVKVVQYTTDKSMTV